MAQIPDDLIYDILLRLPVKPILRFRCVSKHWCDVIDRNDFVKQHLSLSTGNRSKHSLIFDNYRDIYSVGPVYSLHDQALQLVQPIVNPKGRAKVVGTCNGLLCLLYESLDDLIIIWNPATCKHVKLPTFRTIKFAISAFKSSSLHELCKHELCKLVHGFGYDSVYDDYKVVITLQVIIGEADKCIFSLTYVYSLRSDLWRVIDDILEYVFFDDPQRPGALACGAIHWMAITRDFTSLLSAFDLATEKYRVIALPKFPDDDKVMFSCASELDGCLCVNNHMDDVVDVLVMKEYGVTESWTKLLTISVSRCIQTINHIKCLIPLAYSERGDEVLLMLNSEKLMWYSLEKRTVKFVDVCGLHESHHPVICFESLVCLGEKTENDERL